MRRHRGMALIQALLIVAALAAVAAALLIRAERARERLAWRFQADQAALYLESGVELLRQSLPRGVVHPGQDWATPRDWVEIDRGLLEWEIEDLQGRFNLNLLRADPEGRFLQVFEAMAQEAGLSGERLDQSLEALRERDADVDLAFLLRLGSEATTPEEREDWEELRARLWAWPAEEGINLNTMPEPLLTLLLPGLGGTALDRLRGQIEAEPAQEIDDLLDWATDTLGEEAATALEALPLTRQSTRFRALLAARLDTLTLRRSVILDTGGPDGVSRVVISTPGY